MKELDLTQGSVPKVLLHFAVPFLLANVLQALYGGADLFVVGRYDDAASVAAVAIGSQVMQTVTGVILGLTTGITVLIGIATGAKDDRKTASIVGTGIWLFAVVAAVLTALMVALHGQIAVWMHTPVEAMRDTEAIFGFVRWAFLLLWAIMSCAVFCAGWEIRARRSISWRWLVC